jgi:hypothetical protein
MTYGRDKKLYKILKGKQHGRLATPRHKYQDNIKTNLIEIEYEGTYRFKLDQVREQ